MSKSSEWSAGGILLREHENRRELAVIQPHRKTVYCLPKGHIDPGETPQMAAVREVREETGVTGQLIEHIGEVEYSYRFRGRTIHKRVSFFLLRYLEGVIDALEPSMRREVDRAFWIPLDEAESRLAYPGEKEVVAKAMQWLESKNFVLKAPHP